MLFLLFPQTLTQGVIHNMNDSSGESLIQIKNLTAAVKLNNGDTLVTVNNASIELKRGNSYAIVGKSGSGKTTFLMMRFLYQSEKTSSSFLPVWLNYLLLNMQ